MDPLDDESARALRTAWFRFVDTVEPVRADLHRYCLRLTGSVWDAEDLVQDTLLRGFGAIGRGDLHGDDSRVASPRAYLLRIASNLWIDRMRRRTPEAPPEPAPHVPPLAAREAGQALFERASPQQRAAVVLKDVFDFTLEEIAVLLDTTVGTIKSALHRGRANLARPRPSAHGPSKELVERFVAAFNAKDVAGITALLLENTSIEVHGVGGGRGDGREWAENSLRVESEVASYLYEGEHILAVFAEVDGRRLMVGLTRFEETDGRFVRMRSYGYCPDTLEHVAAELSLEPGPRRYHQAAHIVPRMIATTRLPWTEHVPA
jgi:RNA polymerase sigma-70 factor (ECF subfamily)